MRRVRVGVAVVLALVLAGVLGVGSSGAAGGDGTTVAGGNGRGRGAGQLDLPHHLAVGPDGTVYISEPLSDRVMMVSPAGVLSVALGTGTGGSGPNELDGPLAIEVDGAGNLYVADMLNDRIQRRTSAGVVSTVVGSPGPGSPVVAPNGLTTTAAGDLLVVDHGLPADRILRVTPGGVVSTLFTASVGGPFESALDLELDATGNLYVVDPVAARVRKITPGGVASTITAAGGAGGAVDVTDPSGLVVSAAGDLYVTDYATDRVVEITPGGVATTVAGGNGSGSAANQFNGPYGVAFDPNGLLLVADHTNDRVQRFDLDAVAPTPSPGSRVITGDYAGGAGIEGAIARLHMAVHRTQPTTADLAPWIARFRAGTTLPHIARDFTAAAGQYATDYAALSDGAFIAALYTNVLDRSGDPEGLRYWAAEHARRQLRWNTLLGITESAEFKALTGTT